jgi:hypothetical protein
VHAVVCGRRVVSEGVELSRKRGEEKDFGVERSRCGEAEEKELHG